MFPWLKLGRQARVYFLIRSEAFIPDYKFTSAQAREDPCGCAWDFLCAAGEKENISRRRAQGSCAFDGVLVGKYSYAGERYQINKSRL